ncbi:hypothetical protein BGZ63DRAFT_380002 [Mariannaea sp. PMI_226]|nr:hypothetical protein BGZ63DRAFT_380002 [Mariannaea sp. PMI_226]
MIDVLQHVQFPCFSFTPSWEECLDSVTKYNERIERLRAPVICTGTVVTSEGLPPGQPTCRYGGRNSSMDVTLGKVCGEDDTPLVGAKQAIGKHTHTHAHRRIKSARSTR